MSYDETRVETPRPRTRKRPTEPPRQPPPRWALYLALALVVYCVSVVTLDAFATIIDYIDRHL